MNKPLHVAIFPGQGAQAKGMGKDLWAPYEKLAEEASNILGYSVSELCLKDPENRLRLTQFTQPALYVVNALSYYQWREAGNRVGAAAGHSLGEYSALLAAECFDFEMGLRLVQKRGQLMSEAGGGGMAAVIGMEVGSLRTFLEDEGFKSIDVANINSPTQVVIAGDTASLLATEKRLSQRNVRCVMLNVSAPFHSRYMREAQRVFSEFLKDFQFDAPKIPVIANATARPYPDGKIAELLAQQIASPVLWTESIEYLMGQGDFTYTEMGVDPQRVGGGILGKMVEEIRRTARPIPAKPVTEQKSEEAPPKLESVGRPLSESLGQVLGSQTFRNRYSLRYAYVAGGMSQCISSASLVIRMGRAGMIGYLGTGGLSLAEVEKAIQTVQAELKPEQPYGANFLANHDVPAVERALMGLFLKYKVTFIEAAGFVQMTPALVLFRISGLYRDELGNVQCRHHILAKVSRLEIAEMFMSPSPEHVLNGLLKEGVITPEQAIMAREIPMSHELCVEADCGGHTDGGIPTILLPAMLELRRRLVSHFRYREPICMGLAGGIGMPASAAAAFAMGADFIVTGSINQCTVESGASDKVKTMLQDTGIHDMALAPAGDRFESGSRIQVLKKGVLFPMRASKLYSLYTQYGSLEEVPQVERDKLERNLFKRSFDQIWQERVALLKSQGQEREVALAQANPKVRMGQVFRWYFGYSSQLALSGSKEDVVNYQVHTGPALGAFNQWVKGTPLEPWAQRHVDEIGMKLMDAAAKHLRDLDRPSGEAYSSLSAKAK